MYGRCGLIRRSLACWVDVLFAMILTYILANSTGQYFAAQSVPMLDIGSPTTFWKGWLPWMMAVFSPWVYGFPFAMSLIKLSEGLFGCSPGKMVCLMEVRSLDGQELGFWRLLTRFFLRNFGWVGLTLALVIAVWQIAVVALAGIILLSVGSITMIGNARQSVIDKIVKTAVYSTVI